VVRESANRPHLIAAGSIEHDDAPASLVQSIREELRQSSVSVSRAVLLLPRGDLDVHSLSLPPATEAELPEMVGNMLAQKADDSAECVHDFVLSQHVGDAESRDVLTFTIGSESIDTWVARFKEHSLRLEAITFGGIGAVSLLNQVAQHPARTSVVVTTTDQDTDLAVVEEGKPILFRTMPRGTGGEQSVIDQLAGEIQRTLTLVGHPDDEEPRVYLIGTSDDDQKAAAKTLHEQLALPVNLVNPFDQLAGDAKLASHVRQPSRFANLIGTACAWNAKSMQVNLLDPKRPPAKPTLWSRFGFWGVLAGSILAFAGYLAWEQVEDARIELEIQKAKLQQLIKPVKRAQTKQAMLGAVEAWQSNEINWLDELHYLSEKLPPANKATVGGLTMTVAPGQRGRIEMPVEVSESSVRLELEKAIRDNRHAITSKRLTDASNRSNSAWRFKTTISVAPSPVRKSLLEPSPTESPKSETRSEVPRG